MRICRQCGNTYEDEIKFCPVCGCIVEDFAAEMIFPNPSKGKHVGKIIGIIAVCILALAAAFFALAIWLGEDELQQNSAQVGNSEMKVSDTLSFYQNLQDRKYNEYPFTMSASSASFLEAHTDLFPAGKQASLANYIDKSVEYKHLNKNIEKYGDILFENNAMHVIDIHEETVQKEVSLTTVHVLDGQGNSFVILYRGELPDIFKDDTVYVCGLPLGLSSFDNVGGGSTIAAVLAGCVVENTNVDVSKTNNNNSHQKENVKNGIDYVKYYEPVIEEIADADTLGYEYVSYVINDIDKDGIMDLIVISSYDEWFCYTIDNGEVIEIGQDALDYGTFYEADDGRGIFLVAENTGCGELVRITKQGDRIQANVEWAIESYHLNEGCYANNHPITRYDAGDYTVLENPPEMRSGEVVMDSTTGFVCPTSSYDYLTEEDLAGFSELDCRIARNEIYARYGRLFESDDLQSYFNQKRWYWGEFPPDEFDDGVLNDCERANLDFIVQYEAEHGYR